MRRILYLTPSDPFSVESGTEQRSHMLYRALARLADVDVVQLVQGGANECEVEWTTSGARARASFVRPWNPMVWYRADAALTARVERLLKRTIADYDAVVARYLSCACLIDCRTAPLVADLDDLVYRAVPSLKWEVSMWRKRASKAMGWALASRELPRLATAFVVSRADLEVARRHVAAVWLPNVVATPTRNWQQAPTTRDTVLFVGSMWYGPNARAADWLVREIWPLVCRRRPTATLLIAGAAPPDVRALWERHPGVSAPGFVQDLHQIYQSAGAVVVPVRDGGGSPIKLLEALAHGCPTVATSYAAAAFDPELVADCHLLVADRPEDFSALVVQLLEDPGRARKTAADGQAAVSEHFSVARFDAIVAQTLSDVIKRKEGPVG